MILADKIILLRKKCGWSQEQLAEQLDISRQSVSKWESNMSIPDLDKIIKMSDLFGVSTDYLLKDELEIEMPSEAKYDKADEPSARVVTVEEANTYMDIVQTVSMKIAIGVMLCILSPIPLILMAGYTEECFYLWNTLPVITEDMAGGFGVAILLVMIVIAVSILIYNSMKLSKYEYLEKEVISLLDGVKEMVSKRREDYEDIYRRSVVIGVAFCILAVVPLFLAVGLELGDFVYVCCIAVLLLFVAIGTILFVNAGMKWDSYNKLLQLEDYSVARKKRMKKYSAVIGAYWCSVTAIFLTAGFITADWGKVGLIWPVAGVLFAALMAILNGIGKEDTK